MTAARETHRADIVEFRVVLEAESAWALAQFVKRVGWNECRALAEDETQAALMVCALHGLRAALADAGFSPR